MVKKGLVIISLVLFLQGCSALSAIKGVFGNGANNSTDKSVNVEANLAARDNKKSIISHEMTRTYQNKGLSLIHI